MVRQNGEIIAFANVWEGADKEELSIDLMRYMPGKTNGLMEFLFLKLMLWGQAQGYHWFNLGMAPLAGIEAKSGSPLWNRIAELAFRHGETFITSKVCKPTKKNLSLSGNRSTLLAPAVCDCPLFLLTSRHLSRVA